MISIHCKQKFKIVIRADATIETLQWYEGSLTENTFSPFSSHSLYKIIFIFSV